MYYASILRTRIITVKYADNLVVSTKEEEEVQNMYDKLVEAGRQYGVEINVEKKIMRTASRVEPLSIAVGN